MSTIGPQKTFLSEFLDRAALPQGLLLFILSVVIGAATGLAAVFFIKLIHAIQYICFAKIPSLIPGLGIWTYFFIPILGGLLVGPLILLAQEAKGHGVPEVMQALIVRGGRIRARVAAAKIVASALCIGTGGSAGREGPIVQVGSARRAAASGDTEPDCRQPTAGRLSRWAGSTARQSADGCRGQTG